MLMRKKIMAFVFAAALLMALAVPLFAGAVTAYADHPDASDHGITTARTAAGIDPEIAVATTAATNSAGANSNGIAQQPAHHPLCAGHPAP
jgi:Na+-transporting methylmalonyl-CoA/oxaloacetate decarboxylase gamma subunit